MYRNFTFKNYTNFRFQNSELYLNYLGDIKVILRESACEKPTCHNVHHVVLFMLNNKMLTSNCVIIMLTLISNITEETDNRAEEIGNGRYALISCFSTQSNLLIISRRDIIVEK